MDDDKIAWIIIFAIMLVAVIAITSALSAPTSHQTIPHVLVLLTNDTINRQILNNPIPITGSINKISNTTTILYFFNPSTTPQNVNITWTLAYQLNTDYVKTNIQNFILPANTTTEKIFEFYLDDTTPIQAEQQFENAGGNIIYMNVISTPSE